jgi:hypothetical protein
MRWAFSKRPGLYGAGFVGTSIPSEPLAKVCRLIEVADTEAVLIFLQCNKLQKTHQSRPNPGFRAASVQVSARTTGRTSRSECTTASGSPSEWPTWVGGMVLCGTWMARSPALWAPQMSSKRRSPT